MKSILNLKVLSKLKNCAVWVRILKPSLAFVAELHTMLLPREFLLPLVTCKDSFFVFFVLHLNGSSGINFPQVNREMGGKHIRNVLKRLPS